MLVVYCWLVKVVAQQIEFEVDVTGYALLKLMDLAKCAIVSSCVGNNDVIQV
ncbi:hypothetical protein Hdeb2414_s0008g00275851 [Helianthus debilis subsp. tardiflorus]